MVNNTFDVRAYWAARGVVLYEGCSAGCLDFHPVEEGGKCWKCRLDEIEDYLD